MEWLSFVAWRNACMCCTFPRMQSYVLNSCFKFKFATCFYYEKLKFTFVCVGGGDFVLKIHVEKGLDTLVNFLLDSKKYGALYEQIFFFWKRCEEKSWCKVIERAPIKRTNCSWLSLFFLKKKKRKKNPNHPFTHTHTRNL